MSYKPDFIEVMRKIERITQSQWCDQEWLEEQHGIYPTFLLTDDPEENFSDLLFTGTYTEYDELEKNHPQMKDTNGWPLNEVAPHLLEIGVITQDDHDLAMSYYQHIPIPAPNQLPMKLTLKVENTNTVISATQPERQNINILGYWGSKDNPNQYLIARLMFSNGGWSGYVMDRTSGKGDHQTFNTGDWKAQFDTLMGHIDRLYDPDSPIVYDPHSCLSTSD